MNNSFRPFIGPAIADPRPKRASYIIFPTLVLIVASLYWAQAFLIPVALALLLTFLLTPLAAALERFGVGRVLAVLLVVVIVFSLLAGIGWIVTSQFTSAANQLSSYRSNIRKKIVDIRGVGKDGVLEKVSETAKEVKAELKKDTSGAPKPREVVVQGKEEESFWPASPTAAPILERLAGSGFVIILVIFMLIRRENLRNRLIQLVGVGSLIVTTRALEEASQRITRYLVVQSLLNGSFGLAVGIGLFLIGLPYALLWGVLAALLRFIPYIGSWAAAVLPTVLALAVFQGWLWPALVFCLVAGLELINAIVMEPLLYGETAGVSEVGILVSVAFWTWLWGPIGLLLATPLTVCVVVASKYLPELEFIAILFGDQKAIEPAVIYYQRLLAMDPEEAKRILTGQIKSSSLAAAYDDLIVPALRHIRTDTRLDRATETQAEVVFQTTREILAESTAALAAPEQSLASTNTPPAVRILGCPAQDESDALALHLFSQVLDSSQYQLEVIPEEALISEIMTKIDEAKPALIFISSLPPDGIKHCRALCKRIRLKFPGLKIVVGRWGEATELSAASLLSAGADKVGTSLIESKEQVMQIRQILPSTEFATGQLTEAAALN